MNLPYPVVRCQPDMVKLREFYEQMRLLTTNSPELFLKFHPVVNNVECMVGEDLTLGFGAQPFPEDPSLKAIGFVRATASMLGLEQVFAERFLFLKHVLRSQMGTHCILGLRRRDREVHDSLFVVHLDHLNRITMLTATYQAILPPDDTPDDDQWGRLLAKVENDLASSSGRPADIVGDILQITRKGFLWVPDWSAQRYVLKHKLSITTDFASYVVFVDENGKCDVYPASSNDRPSSMRSTYLYVSAWSDAPEEQHPPRHAILRGLKTTQGMLSGPYVAVGDYIERTWPTELDWQPKSKPWLKDSTHFDRAMAYYHVDRIQRYFRDLGLFVLDGYPELNPLHVDLFRRRRDTADGSLKPTTGFDREKYHIRLCTIEGGKNATAPSFGLMHATPKPSTTSLSMRQPMP